MARIRSELLETTPNLFGLGISPTVLERYGVVEARTSVGRRIAVPYLEDCIKLLAFDGSAVWDGDYVPEAGLFGQRAATVRDLILCAHEFEALRIASIIEANPKLNKYHAVALPFNTALGRLGMMVLVDSLKVVASNVYVWSGTIFDSQRDALEQFVGAIDIDTINVESLSLAKMDSPINLTNDEILKVLNGPKRAWSPSNLTTASEIFDSESFMKPTLGCSTGIKGLDLMIKGLRTSELTMYVAGTGVGKSTLLRQQIYHLAYKEGKRCVLGFFEEKKDDTLKNLACIHYNVPFEALKENPDYLTDDGRWDEFLNLPATKRLHFMVPGGDKGFGGMDVDTLLTTVRYLKKRDNIDFVAVDHVSIMISGKESSREGERKDIDIMMTKMAMACVMLDVGILAVCHLSNPEGKTHEEGGRVLLSHMRGSGALKQLAWCVIAQERDQQSESSGRIVLIRVLKNRNGGGRTGLATAMEFVDPLLVERPDINLVDFATNMAKKNPKPMSHKNREMTDLFNGKKASLGRLSNEEF